MCIAQDDEEDKAREIRSMGTIYKNAAITIAAASSSDVNDGFLSPRPVSTICQLPTLHSDGNFGVAHLSPVDSKPPADEPLDQRCWTFQETFLSPRVLYYGSKDLIWKCQMKRFESVMPTHNLYCDTHAQLRLAALPPSVYGLGSQDSAWNNLSWLSVIYNYSKRCVRIYEDRFRALGGVAEELQKASGDIYLAGMWSSSFITQLVWKYVGTEYDSTTDEHQVSPKSPTWSWLTFSRPVEFWTWNGLVEDAKLVSWNLELLDPASPFGHITSGQIQLLASIISASQMPSDHLREYDIHLVKDFQSSRSSDRFDELAPRGEFYYLLLDQIIPAERGSLCLFLLRLDDAIFSRQGSVLMTNPYSNKVWQSEPVKRMVIEII